VKGALVPQKERLYPLLSGAGLLLAVLLVIRRPISFADPGVRA